MSTHIPDIVVAAGPLAGQRFSVPAEGLRLGRSSSCEIAISDPALSRNHCLFEVRDDALWVTDLASANGTQVNGVTLGADSYRLKHGDRIVVGETELALESPDAEPPAADSASDAPPAVDLGLGQSDDTDAAVVRLPLRRLLVWGAAVLAVGLAAVVILGSGSDASAPPADRPVADEPVDPRLLGLTFEKVEADTNGIYRYALSLDADGQMTVAIDDVPKENRHIHPKPAQLSDAALARLSDILSVDALSALDPEYTGVPLHPNTLTSYRLNVIRNGKVFATVIENAMEPAAFREIREKLETFSKNELGIWAIQFSAEKLVAMSQEAQRLGDAKWAERDVQFGNLAAALAAYREAVFYLETVNPKPDGYGALLTQRKAVEEELTRRYREQRFLADRAINLQDWPTAARELRVLRELVPDAKDPRHAEASAKLLDVEARLKKGAAK